MRWSFHARSLLCLDFKYNKKIMYTSRSVEFIVKRVKRWPEWRALGQGKMPGDRVGAITLLPKKNKPVEMTHLSNRMSVGAAHRHSAFRISGKLFRVMFHLSRDQVRQPLTLIRILASSGAMVRPLSCGEHKPRLAQFTTPFVTQTHINRYR